MDIKTRQFGVGEIISKAWQVYWANFSNILLVVLCVYIPINIVTSFIPAGEPGSSLSRLYSDIGQLINSLFGLLATIGIAYIVEQAIGGEKIGWTIALKHGFSRWGSAIGTSFVAGIILLGLTLLLIVPGIIWGVYYLFFVYVVALRMIGGKTALDYSKDLVKGQWWRVAGISLLIGILSFLVIFIITIPFALLPTHQIMNIISNTINDVLSALFIVMMLVFFLNTDYLKHPATVASGVVPVESEQHSPPPILAQ